MNNPVDEGKEEEEDEEEIIVYANFEEGTIDKDVFQQSDLKFKVIGLESQTPIVQIGDTTFKGFWNDTLGTKVLFEEDPSPEPVDPVFTVVPPKMLKYKCSSTKTLELSRIFLKPKNSEKNVEPVQLKQAPDAEPCEVSGDGVLELVEKTIDPDRSTDALMKDIVQETSMDL